ncbi:Holliday junction resolvase RecU [Macrococcus brunensis]|nr:Holliday junction resolvase RecU [Macrococcus brunensis]
MTSYIKNRKNANKGKYLENLIDISNKQYLAKGVAHITNIPTPTKVKWSEGEITGAYHSGKSTVDFIGVFDGMFVAFDAKETTKNYLPFKAIRQHQADYLISITKYGGLGFILVLFREVNELYMISIQEFKELQETINRASIPLQWFQDNKEPIVSEWNIRYHYLKSLGRVE